MQHLAARVRHHGLDAGSGGAQILKTIAGVCVKGGGEGVYVYRSKGTFTKPNHNHPPPPKKAHPFFGGVVGGPERLSPPALLDLTWLHPSTLPNKPGSWIVGLDAEGAVRIWCILHPRNPQPGDAKLPDQVLFLCFLFLRPAPLCWVYVVPLLLPLFGSFLACFFVLFFL